MSFYINKENNWYLSDTGIENIFINEYMITAPGDYVKVYIFARMYAQLGSDITNEMIAMESQMDIEDVLKAWTYWESKGAVKKHFKDVTDKLNYDIEFMSLKVPVTGHQVKVEEEKPEESDFIDENMRGLFMAIEQVTGRMLNPQDMKKAAGWYSNLGADPEIILYAYQYAKEIGKESNQYIEAVIKNWVSKGLSSAEDVENYLSDTNERRYLYKRVFKALGFFDRNPAEKEKEIMDTWFDDYGFTIDKVLDACGKTSGIANPNINYVNKVLSNWYEEGKSRKESSSDKQSKIISESQVLKYYEYLRKKEEEEAQERKEEVLEKIPQIKDIEERLQNINLEISREMFNSDDVKRTRRLEELRNDIDSLTVEKVVMLTENGFEIDYMDRKFKCDMCQDTGFLQDGEKCECFKKRAEEATLWQKNQK